MVNGVSILDIMTKVRFLLCHILLSSHFFFFFFLSPIPTHWWLPFKGHLAVFLYYMMKWQCFATHNSTHVVQKWAHCMICWSPYMQSAWCSAYHVINWDCQESVRLQRTTVCFALYRNKLSSVSIFFQYIRTLLSFGCIVSLGGYTAHLKKYAHGSCCLCCGLVAVDVAHDLRDTYMVYSYRYIRVLY